MITAVDTSVLLDVFGADSRFGPRSRDALRSCLAEGTLVACEVVWAEASVSFPSLEAARDAMKRLGVEFSSVFLETALAASTAWKLYRRRRAGRQRLVAGFLIGAHASLQTDRLLTRDRGFYREYFRGLSVIDPS